MKRKILSIILSVAMVFSLAATLSVTVCAKTSGDFNYDENDDGTIIITEYYGDAETLEIPSEIDGKLVTGIGYNYYNGYAFGNCKSLKNVIIPNSVTSIGQYAFKNAKSIINVQSLAA